jgi:hypothetical protein
MFVFMFVAMAVGAMMMLVMRRTRHSRVIGIKILEIGAVSEKLKHKYRRNPREHQKRSESQLVVL